MNMLNNFKIIAYLNHIKFEQFILLFLIKFKENHLNSLFLRKKYIIIITSLITIEHSII